MAEAFNPSVELSTSNQEETLPLLLEKIKVREDELYQKLSNLSVTRKLSGENFLVTLKHTSPHDSRVTQVFQTCDSELERVSVQSNVLIKNIQLALTQLQKRIDVTANGYVDIEMSGQISNMFVTTNIDFGTEFSSYKTRCLRIQDTLSKIGSTHEANIEKIRRFLNSYQERRDEDFLSGPWTEEDDSNLCAVYLKQTRAYKEPQISPLISTSNDLLEKLDREIQQYPTCHEHNPSTQKSSWPLSICLDILFLLLFLLTCLIFLSLTFNGRGNDSSQWIVAFRFFRGPVFILAFIYMIVINILVWRKCGINYVKIFDFGRPGKVPTLRFLLNICNVFSLSIFVAAVFYSLSMELSWGFYFIKGMAMLLWGLYLVFLLNPVFMWSKSSRWAFARVLLRIVTSPSHQVYFGDFWFADQLNSLVVILLDFEYSICYCFAEFSTPLNPNTCASHSSFIRPIIACMPAFWRLLQCLRNYWDTNDFSHFWNGIKYVTTFPVVILAALVSRTQDNDGIERLYDNAFIYIWVLAGIVHALYTFLWDILRDWGIRHKARKLGIRKDRLYRFKCYYYFAILADFVLRFIFIVKMSLAIQVRVDADLLYTILSFGEMFRRFLWNFFRLEWEQIRIS